MRSLHFRLGVKTSFGCKFHDINPDPHFDLLIPEQTNPIFTPTYTTTLNPTRYLQTTFQAYSQSVLVKMPDSNEKAQLEQEAQNAKGTPSPLHLHPTLPMTQTINDPHRPQSPSPSRAPKGTLPCSPRPPPTCPSVNNTADASPSTANGSRTRARNSATLLSSEPERPRVGMPSRVPSIKHRCSLSLW